MKRAQPSTLHLVLFVAGVSPNSRAARTNLERTLAELGRSDIIVEVVDVVVRPDLALASRVLVTPTLMRSDNPHQRVFGDLSARGELLAFLA